MIQKCSLHPIRYFYFWCFQYHSVKVFSRKFLPTVKLWVICFTSFRTIHMSAEHATQFYIGCGYVQVSQVGCNLKLPNLPIIIIICSLNWPLQCQISLIICLISAIKTLILSDLATTKEVNLRTPKLVLFSNFQLWQPRKTWKCSYCLFHFFMAIDNRSMRRVVQQISSLAPPSVRNSSSSATNLCDNHF